MRSVVLPKIAALLTTWSHNRFGVLNPSSGIQLTGSNETKSFLNYLRPSFFGTPLTRVGGNGDGGYLIPQDLRDIKICFSPGYGENSSFERELFQKYGIRSKILDKFSRFPNPGNSFGNQELEAGKFADLSEGWLGLPISQERVGLQSWIDEEDFEGDAILQMDIEGSEWVSLASTDLRTLLRFRILVIEFHNIYWTRNKVFFQQIMQPTISSILNYFDVVHAHPNNCCGYFYFGKEKFPKIIEVTFHRKDRRKSVNGSPCQLPHTLDVPINSKYKDIKLKFF